MFKFTRGEAMYSITGAGAYSVDTRCDEWCAAVASAILTAMHSWRQKLRRRRSRLRRLADTQAGSRSTFIMSSAK